MIRRSIVAGLTIGVLVNAGLATARSDAERPTNGRELYERVATAAGQGDPRASEQLIAIDKFLRERHMGPDALTLPADSRAAETMGVVQLAVEDRGPWRIDVSNSTRFPSADALDAYRAARHATLDSLAAEDPHREIRVAITPNGPRTVDEVAGILPITAVGEQLVVDVYTADGWLMATG